MDETKDLAKVKSFIGTEAGDPSSALADRSPRSARLVARVSWSWGPAHSRIEEYRIATDRARQTWNLYALSYCEDTGKRVCCRVATGTPYRGVSAKRAAKQLLREAWLDEIKLFYSDQKGVQVDEAGLLSKKEVIALAEEASCIGSSDSGGSTLHR